MFFVDDILMEDELRDDVNERLDKWKKDFELKGLK
jgi:hypothetical protein